jgi:ribosomal protein S27AE
MNLKNNDDIRINIRVSHELLNNAFDFLDIPLEILKKYNQLYRYHSWHWDNYELKTALLNVTIGVELILKAKIASINWRELFQEASNSNKEKLMSGNFNSVKFEDCISRIKKISEIKFSRDIKHRINKIRQIRNKVTHFYFDTKKENFILLASYGIDFFIEFYQRYIFSDFCEEKDRIKKIDYELSKVKDYLSVRMHTISEKMKNLPRPNTNYFKECPDCLQNAFILKDNETTQCLYCGRTDNIKDLAEFHSNYKSQTKICPSCNRNSMTAIHKGKNEKEAWDCIICGHFINRPQKWASLK